MSSAVDGLEPRTLWRHFAELSRIPRGSKNEEQAARYVVSVAERNRLAVTRDAAGNVVVRKPATAGHERAPSVCLQGHLDMVCEKNQETAHDFTRDPIALVRQGPVLKASGTTLGADNGLGVAAALAVLEASDLEHGPLELLFTVDEETGLTGASSIAPDLLVSRIMLNLDSEEEGALYVGCAGGRDTTATLPLDFDPAPPGHATLLVTVRGLRGGHSGLDIDKGRGNAIKILGRALRRLAPLGARVASLTGGNKRNAIPREAEAVAVVPAAQLARARAELASFASTIATELGSADPGVSVQAEETSPAPRVLTLAKQEQLLRALAAAPHGVVRMSPDLAGLVETSTNLAVVETRERELVITTTQRSAIASAKDDVVESVAACFALAGAKVESGGGYPGWKPDLDSRVLAVAKRTYRALFGREPLVKAIHAGLECGIIGEKLAGMDMVSFGPTIEGAHSPDERVQVDTVAQFWRLLTGILRELGTARS